MRIRLNEKTQIILAAYIEENALEDTSANYIVQCLVTAAINSDNNQGNSSNEQRNQNEILLP